MTVEEKTKQKLIQVGLPEEKIEVLKTIPSLGFIKWGEASERYPEKLYSRLVEEAKTNPDERR